MMAVIEMRIVGGKYKRRIIEYPISNITNETRPTKDRIRESIFNALGSLENEACVLDLFAGSGALAIEALSRGALKAILVDNSRSASETIKKNIANLKIDNAKIYFKDYRQFLEGWNNHEKFSLVFLDPPYKMDIYQEVMDYLESHDLLTTKARYVLESDHPLILDEGRYSEIRRYQYGFIHVTIITR